MAGAADSHLPEGREPGPQSRRAAQGSGVSTLLLPAMAILFAACFVGLPLVVVAATDSQPVIFAALGVLAVLFVVAMWLLARRFRPPPPGPFEVLAEPLELRRGEDVEAELVVYEPDLVEGPLEVGLVCVERYDRPADSAGDGGERSMGESVAYERWVPARAGAEEQRFRFRIPPLGPYSHEGEVLSLAWRVSARESGDGEREESDDPIWVLP